MFIKTWKVDREAEIPRGKYDITKILELIESQFHMVFSNKTINQEWIPTNIELK